MFTVVVAALRDGRPGVGGAWTAENLATAISIDSAAVVRDTVVLTVAATVLSLVLGAWLAWLTERTDLRLRGVVYVLVAVPIVVPGVLTAMAWRLLLGERIGLVNHVLGLLGVAGPRTDPHTLMAMVWVAGTDGLTVPFLLTAVALRRLDPTLEEAARVAGPPGAAARRVLLPLMTPALAAAALVTFVRTLGDFEGPILLGLPGGIRVLSSEVYLLVRGFPIDANLAAAFAVLLLLPSLLGLGAYLRVTRGEGRFASVGGRPRAATRRPLRRPRATTALVMSVLTVVVVVPVAVLAYASLLPFYEPPSARALSTLTLRNYVAIVDAGPVLARALRNTVTAVGVATVVAVVLGGAAAGVSLRSGPGWRRWLDPLATAPIALPGVVLGLALLWLYVRLPLPLYGTLLGVGVGLAVFSLPYTTRVVQTALLRIAPELEEASALTGARPSRTLWRVVLPLAAPGVVVAAVLTVVRSAQVLSVPLLVGGPGDEVLAARTFALHEAGRIPEASALGMVMVVALAVLVGLARAADRRWGGRHDVDPVAASEAAP